MEDYFSVTAQNWIHKFQIHLSSKVNFCSDLNECIFSPNLCEKVFRIVLDESPMINEDNGIESCRKKKTTIVYKM